MDNKFKNISNVFTKSILNKELEVNKIEKENLSSIINLICTEEEDCLKLLNVELNIYFEEKKKLINSVLKNQNNTEALINSNFLFIASKQELEYFLDLLLLSYPHLSVKLIKILYSKYGEEILENLIIDENVKLRLTAAYLLFNFEQIDLI